MSIIAHSTISENPIGVESIKSPDSDLKLQARVAVSRTSIIQDTAGLSFGNSILENAVSRNFVETASLPVLSATDIISVVRSYSEDPTVQQLSLGRTDVVVANYKVIDSAGLRLVAFERPDDDEPSEQWREYTGLPIQPIGYSPISSEQFDINFRSFSEISEGGFEIAASEQIQIILNSNDSTFLSTGDQSIFNTALNSFDIANLLAGSEFTFISALNSFDAGSLDLAAAVVQSAVLTSVEQGNVDVVGFDQLSMSYFSFEEGKTTIQGKTSAKEYTFLQQEFAIDRIKLNITARSNEAYVEARDGTSISRQIWIG